MDLDDAVGGELLDGVTGLRAILAHLRVKPDHSGEIGIRERLDVTRGGVRDGLCAASDQGAAFAASRLSVLAELWHSDLRSDGVASVSRSVEYALTDRYAR